MQLPSFYLFPFLHTGLLISNWIKNVLSRTAADYWLCPKQANRTEPVCPSQLVPIIMGIVHSLPTGT